MASDIKNLVSGAATVTLGGTEIASVDEKGIKIIVKKAMEKLGTNLSFRGTITAIERVEEVIVEFISEEANVKKIAQALFTGNGGDALGAYEENATSPNYFKLNMDSNIAASAALVISTVGPEYVAAHESTRTITFAKAVPATDSWEMSFGYAMKQLVPFRFLILKADSGYDVDMQDTWT